ncbi:electron transporter RnfC, partial [Citrobacter amalonaticus]|nr:electron transporter RnfC [Citrobacter amalonaticus]
KQAQQVSSEPAEPSPEPVDPRKAAIAAAIARAKAKKDAQQQVVNEE